MVDRGIQTLKKDLATRVARKGGVEKQPATELRVLQDNADRFQHNKDLTNRRIRRGFNPQYGDVQQLRAVDSMPSGAPRALLKLALPAPQGAATRRADDKAGQASSCKAAGHFLAPPRRRT